MTIKQYIKLGQLTAAISFLLGTILFGLYYQTSKDIFLFIGYPFILITGLFNIVIVAILWQKRRQEESYTAVVKTIIIMLINIPVMLLYCSIAIFLLGTMRITLVNETDTILTEIEIIGCGGGTVGKLAIGEEKTIWVRITGDCSLSLSYQSEGLLQQKVLASYITSLMGQKVSYKINDSEEEIFL